MEHATYSFGTCIFYLDRCLHHYYIQYEQMVSIVQHYHDGLNSSPIFGLVNILATSNISLNYSFLPQKM